MSGRGVEEKEGEGVSERRVHVHCTCRREGG